jgi:hypothetical protein
MIIEIRYKTKGPYKSVQEMIDNCGCLALPTSQFYQDQEKVSVKITQGVIIDISDHFGPILWLYPSKGSRNINQKVIVKVNGELHPFPHNFADCYGISEKDVIKVLITKRNIVISKKVTFYRLEKIDRKKKERRHNFHKKPPLKAVFLLSKSSLIPHL